MLPGGVSIGVLIESLICAAVIAWGIHVGLKWRDTHHYEWQDGDWEFTWHRPPNAEDDLYPRSDDETVPKLMDEVRRIFNS